MPLGDWRGIPILRPEAIADEWTKQTVSSDPEVVQTVKKMLMQSWPAYVHYTGPLGMQTLTDITGSHYGPNIESSENNGWGPVAPRRCEGRRHGPQRSNGHRLCGPVSAGVGEDV